MIKLLKRMRKREALMALLCAVLVVAQVYFDLKLPDYMTRLTTLIKTPGSVTADILSVGGEMLLCTLASAVLAVGCGYLAAKTASGFSFSVRADLFHHVMDAGSEEMQSFSVPSLITRTTNDITQIQMIVAMGLQMLMKAPIMAVWAIIKILGKSWTLSAVTGGFVVAIVVMVLLIMSSCLPRFRQVQKKTDQINRPCLRRGGLSEPEIRRPQPRDDEPAAEKPAAVRPAPADARLRHERAGARRLLGRRGAG